MGFFYGFDMTYLVFIVPCIIITLICQVKVKTTFSKYSQIRNSRNMTGAQAAEYVLRQHGVTGVRIEHVAGSMTDQKAYQEYIQRRYNASCKAVIRCA